MGRRVRDLGLGRAPGQRVVDGAGGDARAPNAAALVDRQKEPTGPVAPDREPGVHGDGRARLHRHRPVLVALATLDRQRGWVGGIVLNLQGGQFGAAQAADIEAGQHRRIPRPGRRAVPRARLMGKRRVPEPLHPREQDTAAPAPVGEGGVAPVEESAPLPELDTELDLSPPEIAHSARNTPAPVVDDAPGGRLPSTRRASGGARAERTATRAYQHRDEEQVNLGVRVPRELDNRLLGLVYQLRMQGIRVSKAELVAMALQELPEDATPVFMRKVEQRQQ